RGAGAGARALARAARAWLARRDRRSYPGGTGVKRAKTRRPGTRGGRRVPTDLPDAAEAALDELLDQRLGAGEEAAVPVARKSDERTVRRPKVPPPGPKSPPKPKRLPSSAQLPDTTPVRRADPQEFSADSITEAEPLDDQQLVEEHALA